MLQGVKSRPPCVSALPSDGITGIPAAQRCEDEGAGWSISATRAARAGRRGVLTIAETGRWPVRVRHARGSLQKQAALASRPDHHRIGIASLLKPTTMPCLDWAAGPRAGFVLEAADAARHCMSPIPQGFDPEDDSRAHEKGAGRPTPPGNSHSSTKPLGNSR